MAGPDTTLPGVGSDRYQLHAYVASGKVIRRTPSSTATFTQVYQLRLSDYRYAVVSQWDCAEHSWRYLVWDLFNVKKWVGDYGETLITPAPRLTHTDLDAAIMATVMLYNDGGGK